MAWGRIEYLDLLDISYSWEGLADFGQRLGSQTQPVPSIAEWVGADFVEADSERDGTAAYFVTSDGDRATEIRLNTRMQKPNNRCSSRSRARREYSPRSG